MRNMATALSLLFFLNTIVGCGVLNSKRYLINPQYPQSLSQKSEYLKAHMQDGSLYVLQDWDVDGEKKIVTGPGERYGILRQEVEEDYYTIPITSVAIIETNVPETNPTIAVMTIVTVASLGLTIMCALDPKACFGSCPTFYISSGEKPILQAEGFSSSIARSLEAVDIDALYRARTDSRELKLTMKNEAYETHVVRHAHLLAVPRDKGKRIFTAPDGTFREAETILTPRKCTSPAGDCRGEILAFDDLEYFSKADPEYLATKEIIDLEFEKIPEGEAGLVIGSRQSLMTTFLLYQSLAYMGRYAGNWFADLERGKIDKDLIGNTIGRELGDIEVLIPDKSGNWIPAGEAGESGPLASDIQVIPFSQIYNRSGRVRLRLTKGRWRLNYIALARLSEPREPVRITPAVVLNKDVRDDRAREILNDPERVLTTMPGDEYTMIYNLPPGAENYELFLESKGYYYEWIREAWLEEENFKRLFMVYKNPRKFLKLIAPEFKKYEDRMEKIFWSSKYVQQ